MQIPWSEEAEASVLGSMMLDPEVIPEVLDAVIAEDFYRPAHRKVFGAILRVYAQGVPVDEIAVVEELRRTGELDEVGGALGVHDLVQGVAIPASAPNHARIVADHATLRRLLEASSRIQELISAGGDARTLIDEAERLVYTAGRRRTAQEVAPIDGLVSVALEQIERAHQGHGVAGIRTGFVDLDKKLGGIRNGELILLAARPAVGKSTLAADIARHVAGSGHRVAIFSLEMSATEICHRMLCAEASVPGTAAREGKLSQAEWERLTWAAERLAPLPVTVVDAASLSIVELRAHVRRLRRQGLGLLVVDYLQLMLPDHRSDSRQQEVAEISRGLKLLAKEAQVPVLALSQLNRDPERRAGQRPQLSDLRDSGALEQDADVVLLLHRKDEDAGPDVEVEVIVAKHRNGPTGSLRLLFQARYPRFRNLAGSEIQQQVQRSSSTSSAGTAP